MRRLKIALLSRWLWEENRRTGTAEGGPTQQLAEAVAAIGHEVIVLSQSPRAEKLEAARVGALEVWLSPREKRRDFMTGLRDKWAKQAYHHRKVHSDALDLADFLNQRGPFDVLWAHCEEPDGLVAAVAARSGVPVPPVVTQIQALRYRFRRGVPMFNQKAALRLAFRAADRILANSELVAESLAAYAGGSLDGAALKKKTHVVSPNLRREFLQVARANAPGPTPEPGRILFFGALNEKKGADLFLKAICESEAALSGGVFVVAGDFTENDPRFRRRWAEALAAAEIQLPPTQLQLPGKLSLEETLREIQRASLVVFPSLFDEYSRALVEALILCRPVITTKGVGAWPLVAEHVCGLVIEPNDAAALTEAIDTMMHPQAHYAANALHLAHRLLHEVSPEAIALQIEHHLQETARPSS